MTRNEIIVKWKDRLHLLNRILSAKAPIVAEFLNDLQDYTTELDEVTRFEVISPAGRLIVRNGDVKVALSYQDNGRTLKVLLKRIPTYD